MRGEGSVLRLQIEEAIDAGASLDEVSDELIDPATVSGESRDALWLYAWGCCERRERDLSVGRRIRTPSRSRSAAPSRGGLPARR